jgi:hypothetical protein
MVPQHALVAILSFTIGASAQRYSSKSTSAFWTVTSRYAAAASPSPYTYTYNDGSVETEFYTGLTRQVKSTVTPTATPLSTSRYVSSYDDVEDKYEWYGPNVFKDSDLEPDNDDLYYSSTEISPSVSSTIFYSMPVTMTAPSSCPTQFTVTTTASVSIPSAVRGQITPSSTIDGGMSTMGSYYTYTVQTWILNAGAAPFTSTDDYYYEYYIASCSTPPAARTTNYSSGGGSGGGSSGSGSSRNSDDDDYYSGSRCYRSSYWCGTSFKTWIIIVASVIPGLFLLGIIESWFWFRRLMMGKSAMRFGTVCWVLISLWILCFTRMQDARSKEDQKVLQEKWKNMGSGAAFKAWLKYALRRSYPVEYLGQYSKLTVGIVPAGQPLHPAMAQGPPGLMQGPPPPPGTLGQVYYYGPPPPGWVPTPDGTGFMPPQGYAYPPPQQTGYYAGEAAKAGTTVSTSPISQHPAMAQQPQGYPVSPIGTSPAQPQAPQPAYHGQNAPPVSAPSPPPKGPVPAPPALQATANVREAPADPVQRPANAPQPPHPKNDPNDRSLYE